MSDLTYVQSVVMGALQGVAELFPVSSLGHSILVPAWLGGSWSALVTQQSSSAHTPFLAFVVALHVATAFALLIFYWRDWRQVIAGVGDVVRDRGVRTARARLLALLVTGTIPVGVVGLLLEKPLRALFANPLTTAVFLTLNGAVLLAVEVLTRRARRARPAEASEEVGHLGADAFADLGYVDALVIGASQILALLPGISRSGVTISTGLLRRLDHARATHFAFLLATPVILAAGLLKVPELLTPETAPIRGQVLVGALVAFVAAYAAVRFLDRFMRTRTLFPFVVYCLVAGVASIVRFA